MSNTVDFFVAGGTLRSDADSYVIRAADRELFERAKAGEFCYILTPRQMGKSSLMVRTAQRLKQAGQRVAVIDLTGTGTKAAEIDAWYQGLLMRLKTDLGLRVDIQAWWAAHPISTSAVPQARPQRRFRQPGSHQGRSTSSRPRPIPPHMP